MRLIRNIVVATTPLGGIGKKGKMPWKNEDDMKRFVKLTKGQCVIMGRKTYESIGHMLKDRFNIVVTRNKDYKFSNINPGDTGMIAESIEDAEKIAETNGYKQVFYIGGGEIYRYILDRDMVDTIYWTKIKSGYDPHDIDTFFPKMWGSGIYCPYWYKVMIENKTDHEFHVIFRKREESHCDKQYLDLLNEILENGTDVPTRVGVARSIFDAHLQFDLRKGLPVLTTKKLAIKSVIVELVWFLRGCRNIKYLIDNNVHIWDKDAYAHYVKLAKAGKQEPVEFDTFIELVKKRLCIDICGKKYRFGDVGPIYGEQWAGFDNGINQLMNVVNTLTYDPYNRRLVVSAWNPNDIPNMALPPCHYAMEFYAEPIPFEERVEIWRSKNNKKTKSPTEEIMDNDLIPKNYLSLRWIQRSCDMALGVPFNILSYALLLSVIAKEVNMVPKTLAGSLGNAHIYKNHIDGVREQLERNPFIFKPAKLVLPEDMHFHENLEPEDIVIEDYDSYPSIKFDLFTDASKQE